MNLFERSKTQIAEVSLYFAGPACEPLHHRAK